MSIDPHLSGPPADYTGRYYALPLRGRLTPYEGGTFANGPSTIPGHDQKEAEKPEKKAGFSFAGFLDMINPLQHIPIVSSLYRRITGDEITPVGRIAGDALFFGPVGFAAGLINTVIEKVTGKDPGGHVMTALLGDKEKAPDPLNMIAQDDSDDGVNNVLAAIPQPSLQRGRVTVAHPKAIEAPVSLDPATFDALARTIGGTEPLAHLVRPPHSDTQDTSDTKDTTPTAPASSAAATNYNDALIRMQQGLERYQAQRPGLALTYTD